MTVHGTELHNDFLLTFSYSRGVCSLDILSVSDDFTCTGPFNTNGVILSPPSTFYHSSSSSQSSLLELSGPCAPAASSVIFPSNCSHMPLFVLLMSPHVSYSHIPHSVRKIFVCSAVPF